MESIPGLMTGEQEDPTFCIEQGAGTPTPLYWGSYKRLLGNFHQSKSPYTFNVKFSKTAQNSAMSNGNSTKMLYII